MMKRDAFRRAALAMAGSGLLVAAAAAAPVDDTRLAHAAAEPENWLSFGHNYTNQRYSGLSQINRANVGRLKPRWTFRSGAKGRFQVQPLVAEPVQEVGAVAGEDHQPATIAEGRQQVHDRLGGLGVEGAERLVEQQHRRCAAERRGDLRLARHPGRVRPCEGVAALVEAGGHVGRIDDGTRRRECATRLQTLIEATLDGRAPWGFAPMTWDALLLRDAISMPGADLVTSLTNKHLEMGDLVILAELRRLRRNLDERVVVVKLWTLDAQLPAAASV